MDEGLEDYVINVVKPKAWDRWFVEWQRENQRAARVLSSNTMGEAREMLRDCGAAAEMSEMLERKYVGDEGMHSS